MPNAILLGKFIFLYKIAIRYEIFLFRNLREMKTSTYFISKTKHKFTY